MLNLLTRKQLIILASVLLLVLVVVVFWRGRKPAIETERYESLGTVMAGQTAKMLKGNGSIVMVIPSSSKTDLSAIDIELRAFRRELAKSSGIKVVAEEKVQVDSPRVDDLLTPDLYAGFASRYAQVNAIVSFVGVAFFSPEQLKDVAPNSPPIYTVSMGDMLPHSLIDAGLVTLAIMPKSGASGAQAAGSPLPKDFASYYQIVMP